MLSIFLQRTFDPQVSGVVQKVHFSGQPREAIIFATLFERDFAEWKAPIAKYPSISTRSRAGWGKEDKGSIPRGAGLIIYSNDPFSVLLTKPGICEKFSSLRRAPTSLGNSKSTSPCMAKSMWASSKS